MTTCCKRDGYKRAELGEVGVALETDGREVNQRGDGDSCSGRGMCREERDASLPETATTQLTYSARRHTGACFRSYV